MPSPRIRVLVPSSERKRPGGSRAYTFQEAQQERSSNRFTSLTRMREKALGGFLPAVNGKGFAAEVLRLREPALSRAATTNLEFYRSPLRAAIDRERGPLFVALRPESGAAGGDEDLLRRLREDLVIVCPLLGLLAATDLVPQYRCPIGAQIPEWGSLHAFWKPHVTTVLNRLCHGRRVFSFLTGRLQALWEDDGGALDVVHIGFARIRKDGRVLPENAGTSRLAGELGRVIVRDAIVDREPVLQHRFATGHVFAPHLSRLEERRASIIFAREL